MNNKKTILIIDDSTTTLILLEWALQQNNYEAIIANSVKEAKKIISKSIPDLILLDLSMPDISGYDFLKMRDELHIQDTPIIVVSAFDNKESIDLVQSLGATEFIPKPFIISNVIDTIKKYLELS